MDTSIDITVDYADESALRQLLSDLARAEQSQSAPRAFRDLDPHSRQQLVARIEPVMCRFMISANKVALSQWVSQTIVPDYQATAPCLMFILCEECWIPIREDLKERVSSLPGYMDYKRRRKLARRTLKQQASAIPSGPPMAQSPFRSKNATGSNTLTNKNTNESSSATNSQSHVSSPSATSFQTRSSSVSPSPSRLLNSSSSSIPSGNPLASSLGSPPNPNTSNSTFASPNPLTASNGASAFSPTSLAKDKTPSPPTAKRLQNDPRRMRRDMGGTRRQVVKVGQSSKSPPLPTKRKVDDVSSPTALRYSNENVRHPNLNAKRATSNNTNSANALTPLKSSLSLSSSTSVERSDLASSSSQHANDELSEQMVPEPSSLIQYRPGRFRF